MHVDLIEAAGIVLSMIGVGGGFVIFAVLVTAPHALLAALEGAQKRLRKKRRKWR